MSSNPFSPEFNIIPKIFLNSLSVEELFKVIPHTAYILHGLRGAGKSVTLNYVGSKLNEGSDWLVVKVPNSDDFYMSLIRKLYRSLFNSNLKNQFQLKVRASAWLGPVNLSAEMIKSPQWNQINPDPISMLDNLFGFVSDHHQKVLLLVDEATPRKQLIDFLINYGSNWQEISPVSLILTGIDSDLSKLLSTKGLTYLSRSRSFRLSMLDRSKMANAYAKYLQLSSNDAYYLANLCGGYGYGFQLLGSLIWQNLDNPGSVKFSLQNIINKVINDFKNNLFSQVYRITFQDLTKTEQSVIRLLAEDNKDLSVTQIARLQDDNNKISRVGIGKIVRQLVYLHILRQPSKFTYAFALPYFAEFAQNIDNPMSGAYIGI